MRDLVDIMSDEESMVKMGMKMKFGEENPDEREEVKPCGDDPFNYMVSEYTMRESHLQDKRYRVA